MRKRYVNEIKIPTDEDMTDEELEIYNLIRKQSSELVIRHSAEQIAYYLKMYLKYGCIDKCSYDVHAKSILEDIVSNEEVRIAISKSKTILKEKYNIDIVQLSPLILSSLIPFNEIEEGY